MSLIHQALKKVEGPQTRRTGVESAFKTGRANIRRYAIPALLAISIISASYLFLAPAKEHQSAQPAAAAAPAPGPIKANVPADFNSRGMDEFRARRYQAAEELFRKALQEDPAQVDVHNNLGLALMRLGRKGDAEAAFKKALEVRPEHPEALNNYASLLAETGRQGKAIALLERALKADPAYADARLNLAILHDKRGDLQRALSGYEEFMRLEPSSDDAAQVRKRLMHLRSELIVKKAGGR